MDRRKLRPWVSIVLLVLYAIDIFWLSGITGRAFGFYGTILHELVLVVIAVGAVLLCRADMRIVFPIRKPQASKVLGTLVFWMGAFWGVMLITMIAAYIFPSQMFRTGQGIQHSIWSVPFLASLFIISVVPAICEEAAFRGALFNSLWGKWNKWVVIVLVSAIFGAFHGSIWRFIPTTLLGIGMAYLLVETGNMFYNILFHFVNNAVPVILLGLLNLVYGGLDFGNAASAVPVTITELPFASVAIYMIYGGASPMLLYVGNYLIHKGQRGYDRGLFPREKTKVLIALIAAGIGIMVLGYLLFFLSIIFEAGLYEEFSHMM